MPMYRWHSEALRNYSDGDVIIAAPDVETARSMIMSMAKQAFEGHYWNIITKYDEDDLEELKKFKTQLEIDIREDPDVQPAFFLPGSE